jgi:hypothetical protein
LVARHAKRAFRDNGELFKVELVDAIPEDNQIKISTRRQIWSISSAKSNITARIATRYENTAHRSCRCSYWSRL